MLVTLYLAAAFSAAPVQEAVYQPAKKSTPAQMVVLRVSRGAYGGMRGCRTPAPRGRAACSMPCHTSYGQGAGYSTAGACGAYYGQPYGSAACAPGRCLP